MNDALERSISRVVDRCDTPDDWQEITRAITQSRAVESEIIDSLRSDAILRSEVNLVTTLAATVDLPAAPRPRLSVSAASRWRQAATLIAACLMGLIVGFAFWGGSEPTVATPAPAESRPSTEIYNDYLQVARSEGRSLDILPDLVLEVRPAEDSELVEVFTLKRVLERRFVDEIIRTALDDSGQTVAIPVDREQLEKPRAF